MLANLFFLFALTLFGIAGTILSVFNYNPYEAGNSVFAYFYGSTFIAIVGIFSILIYYIKLKLLADKKYIAHFWPSVRQGTLLGLCIVAILALKGFGLLDIWVGIPAVIAIVLLELFFQTDNKNLKGNKKKLT